MFVYYVIYFIIIVISFITVFAGVLFVHQLGANHVPTMEVKSVGTFPVILLKLATPPLPPQTKLNLEQNG